ncbi:MULTISPECIES: GAF domain-containing protein [unclassified Roseateles]|uniref:GAF domain-containing protein n=1 Tax=unclassified Roseateles TaxID=2626991 RepID=UPI0006F8DCD7|nr:MULTISPECIES: GAF domain-containing protein [unclassified Roseateles]KQW41998.1 PAS sensor protein [Pelomonas sp. Root405]KRA67601.1 PAS sensor protein [Pelomonas sp. Root662]
MQAAPAFGQADLTNCERELIHLAGSVQPHGALLVLAQADLRVLQVSGNVARLLGVEPDALLQRPLAVLGGDIADRVAHLQGNADLRDAVALQCRIGPSLRRFDGALHRIATGELVLELEPSTSLPDGVELQDLAPHVMTETLTAALQRFGAAPSVGVLADAVVEVLRHLTGYDRVVVYKFDPDGHGKVIAEARHPRLESLLGHHYPASDIPQRARALYLLNRVRMLVDVDAVQSPLLPGTGEPLDMSLCQLRSMSPLHLQYLRNMGVTATLTASLVREGQLWGLIAAHHYSPRYLRCTVRAAADLLAEVASTRISAIENYAHAQVALMVRRLEQRLVEATSTEGDWRYALFRNPRTLLQPLEATGAALFCEGEVLTTGEAPSTPELRALLDWVQAQPQTGDAPFACASVGQANPGLASLTPTASGVLAVRLSTNSPDWLIWFRKEQLQSVTWAGDPSKPMVANNPLELSPRRSFAAWSEIVRGTAVPWSTTEVALARGIGVALVDIIVQVHAVRLLIAEHQLVQIRGAVAGSREPVLVADAKGEAVFANDALVALRGQGVDKGSAIAALFAAAPAVQQALEHMRGVQSGWRRELDFLTHDGGALPMAVHAEPVHGRDGKLLGYVLTLLDLREARRADTARLNLESALRLAAQASPLEADEVISAILTNASLAAMDIADARGGPPVAPLLQELETSTRRAAGLYAQIRSFSV